MSLKDTATKPARVLVATAGRPDALPESSYPDPEEVGKQWGQDEYKILRLQEAADLLRGTILEGHTVRLLAMLLQEDGSMTAERRHDCAKGVCFAIGIMGHHICARGTPLIYDELEDPSSDTYSPHQKYCSWKNGVSPQARFEKDYPGFATEWRVQFAEYMLRMTQCFDAGRTEDQCVQAWNPGETGRIRKVKRHEGLVKAALGW